MNNKSFFLFLLLGLFYVTANAQTTPTMVHVEGGSFNMVSDNGYDQEKPVHQITVSGFYMCKYVVTVGEYKLFCTSSGRAMPSAPSWGWHNSHPIINVSWDDAVAYCDWLSDKTGKMYRLPSEAEWVYAARGGSQSKGFKYSGGQNLDNVGWYGGNSSGRTHPVAQKRANELGLYDMSGNVWVWCKDWTGDSHIYRILRGGSWFNKAAYCRVDVDCRNGDTPTSRDDTHGFRLVSSE